MVFPALSLALIPLPEKRARTPSSPAASAVSAGVLPSFAGIKGSAPASAMITEKSPVHYEQTNELMATLR
jgi:hypothetical protein